MSVFGKILGGTAKIDINVPNIDLNVKGPRIGVDMGGNFSGPRIGANVNGPRIGAHQNIDVNISGPRIPPPNINVNVHGPNIPPQHFDVNIHGPKIAPPPIDVNVMGPPIGVDMGANIHASGMYPPPQTGFPPQPEFPPQPGFTPPAFPPESGPGFPPADNSDIINKLNETIKSYEAKLKLSENDYINLKKASMDDRSRLQETIDALNKQLAEKDKKLHSLEVELAASTKRIEGFDAEMHKMRVDFDNLIKERDSLVIKLKADDDEIFRLGEENKSLHIQITAKINEFQSSEGRINDLTNRCQDLEFQLKGRDDQIIQINMKNDEEKRNMQMHIDSINGQLMEARDKLKAFINIHATIKKYEEFLNRMKIDIINFQSATPPVEININAMIGPA